MISGLLAGSCFIPALPKCKMIRFIVSVNYCGCNPFLCLKIFVPFVHPLMLDTHQNLYEYTLKTYFEIKNKKGWTCRPFLSNSVLPERKRTWIVQHVLPFSPKSEHCLKPQTGHYFQQQWAKEVTEWLKSKIKSYVCKDSAIKW